MPKNYSLAPEARVSSLRRILLITAFLAIASIAVLHTHADADADADAQAAGQPAVADTDSIETLLGPVTATRPTLALGDIARSAVDDALAVPPPAATIRRIVVTSGQSLSSIFEREGLPPADWLQITALGGECARLKRIRTGDHLTLSLVNDQLEELSYPYDETHTLSVRRSEHGFDAVTLTASLEHRTREGTGVISNSLFADAHKAGLPDRMILEFADIFGYDIDFAQDLQEGDRFSVIYDELYKSGRKLREGDILAAEFINQGHIYRAVRYVDSDGRAAYYTPEGQSLRKAFIRTPVDFARISSGFNLHRRHPILNTIRAHKGVDYAAPIGTPVHATGDGRIEFIGRKGGYGNVVMIRHGAKYETVYGHLSRFRSGLKLGSKVSQGQVIAYVGMTGLATGPHLHYEFRVDGIHRNPVTVPLPRAVPLSPQILANFHLRSAPLVAELVTLSDHGIASAAN